MATRHGRRYTLGALTIAAGAFAALGVPAAATAATDGTAAGSADPSLSTMDAAGDHALGASVAAHAAASADAAAPERSTAPQAASTAASGPPPGRIQGMDVSAWQPDVDFGAAYAQGARFAYVKVSEGISYQSRTYRQQYYDSGRAGLVRGGYVYAQPGQANGSATAEYFFASGGGWSADGITLPPLLDIEYGSAAQGTCYGLSAGQMVSWISQFSNTVYAHIHRWPAIYTTTDWWNRCTGNDRDFPGNPLFVALYPVHDFTTPGSLGASWSAWTFWQWASAGPFPGDQDVYAGSGADLVALARRTD